MMSTDHIFCEINWELVIAIVEGRVVQFCDKIETSHLKQRCCRAVLVCPNPPTSRGQLVRHMRAVTHPDTRQTAVPKRQSSSNPAGFAARGSGVRHSLTVSQRGQPAQSMQRAGHPGRAYTRRPKSVRRKPGNAAQESGDVLARY